MKTTKISTGRNCSHFKKEIRRYDFDKLGAPLSYAETGASTVINGWYYDVGTLAENDKGKVRLLAYMTESTLDVYLATYTPDGKLIDTLPIFSEDDNANGPTDFIETEIKNNLILRKTETYEPEVDSSSAQEDRFTLNTDLYFLPVPQALP